MSGSVQTPSREELAARDPATGAILGYVPATAPEGVGEVVDAVAKVQPLWSLLRVKDRARYMRRMAQAVIDDFDELCESISREQGRPRAETAALELLAAIDALVWIAEEGAAVLGGRRVRTSRSLAIAKRARIAYEPFGVIGVIGAGSAPFAQPLGQIAGALLAGNGVTFKPAARAALAGERITRVLGRAGLPEGLVRTVHGGAEVGVALAQSPVDKLLFTGSPSVGRAVARACVSREKEVTVELGGKDAMIVLADAHVPRAVAGALWAGCAGAGQARGSVERVYVLESVYERFLAGLVRGARALHVGDPADPRTQVGPLSSRRRAEHVHALVQEAVAAGAHLHCGGPVNPPGCDAGAFYAPAVLSGATHDMRVLREPLDGARARGGARGEHRRGDRARQRQRLRARGIGVDRRPLPGRTHSARPACRHGVAQRPPAHAHGVEGTVGRGGGSGSRAHARRGGAARLRPGKADHLGPALDAGPVVGSIRRDEHPRRACGGAAALGARHGPRAGLAPGCPCAQPPRRARLLARPAARLAHASEPRRCGYA